MWSSGYQRMGYWKKDKLHGYGKLVFDGNVREGLWEEAGFYDSKTPKNVKEVKMYDPKTNPIAR